MKKMSHLAIRTAGVIFTIILLVTQLTMSYAETLLISNISPSVTTDAKMATMPVLEITGESVTNYIPPLDSGEWVIHGNHTVVGNTISNKDSSSGGSFVEILVEPNKRFACYSTHKKGNRPVLIRFHDSLGNIISEKFFSMTNVMDVTSPENAVYAKVQVYQVNGDGFEISDIMMIDYEDIDLLEPGYYVEGTQQTSDLMVEIRNKNYANGYKVGKIHEGLYTADDNYIISEMFGLPNANSITFSMSKYDQQDWSGLHCYDHNGNYIQSITKVEGSQTYTLPSGTMYAIHSIRFKSGKRPHISSILDEYKPQIELGSIVTQFVKPVLSRGFISSDYGFSDEDIITVREGKAYAKLLRKTVELNSASQFTSVGLDGFKKVTIKSTFGNGVLHSERVTKFNGKVLDSGGKLSDIIEHDQSNLKSNGDLTISISNNDSGWGDLYNPSAEEIKAYFNGWVMHDGDTLGKVTDSTVNIEWHKRYQGIGDKTELKFGAFVESGSVEKSCPVVEAYGNITKGYIVNYRLNESENNELELAGSFSLVEGINTITVYSGVRQELIKPKWNADNGYLYINVIDDPNVQNCPLSKEASSILYIENCSNKTVNIDDFGVNDLNCNGYVRLYSYDSYGIQEKDAYLKDYYLVTYKTVAKNNDSAVFKAKVLLDDSLNGTISALINRVNTIDEENSIMSNKIKSLENTINELVNQTNTGELLFQYDDSGNLTNILAE